MSEFVVKVDELDALGEELSFPVRNAWLGACLEGLDEDASDGLALKADPSAPEGEFRCRAHATGRDVLIDGDANGRIVAQCIRCLEDAPVDVEAHVTVLMTPKPAHQKQTSNRDEDEDVLEDDVLREYYTGDEIVLDEVVRDFLILALPMQPLCRPDCPGIEIPEHVRPPADFGAPEAGVDPRLAPLLKLKGKQEKE